MVETTQSLRVTWKFFYISFIIVFISTLIVLTDGFIIYATIASVEHSLYTAMLAAVLQTFRSVIYPSHYKTGGMRSYNVGEGAVMGDMMVHYSYGPYDIIQSIAIGLTAAAITYSFDKILME